MDHPPQKILRPNKSTNMVSWYEENKAKPCKQQAARAEEGGHHLKENSKRSNKMKRRNAADTSKPEI